MKTTPSTTSKGSPEGAPRNAWTRFWFQPTDPTTLGFMRIMAGLLLIYIQMAYCLDLREFFGPKSFWDQETANRERHDSPIYVQNFSWEPDKPQLQTPQILARRIAVFDFLKHVPAEKEQRDISLRYLYFLLDYGRNDQKNPENYYHAGLDLMKAVLQLRDTERDEIGEKLADEKFEPANIKYINLPAFFVTGRNERVKLWNDLLEFLRYVPMVDPNLRYVTDWLKEMRPLDPRDPTDTRRQLTEFLQGLPDGAESKRIIDYFENWRTDPRETYAQGRPAFSIWFHVSTVASMWTFHLLFLFLFILFTIGFCTRVTSVMTWLAALFYIHRNQYVLFGMDTMMNILLFYIMIGPSGAALSVDRLITRYRASRAMFKAGGQSVPWAEGVLSGPRPSALANFAIRLFQIHFCFIYCASGLAKLKGPSWWSTQAAWSTMANPEFCPTHLAAYRWMLENLASSRPVLYAAFMIAVYGTLFLEISLPFLIWTRLRPFLVMGGVFFHTGIACIMGLTCFGLLMMTMLLCYIPSSVIRERLLWPRGTGPKLTVRYSHRNSRDRRAVSLLRALDLTGQITWHDESSKNSATPIEAQLVDDQGHTTTGYAMVQRALQTLVFGRTIAWVLWIPGVSLLVRHFIGDTNAAASVSKTATPPAVAATRRFLINTALPCYRDRGAIG